MKRIVLFLLSTALLTASCVENSSEYQKLKSENEELKADKAKSTEELNEMLSTLNDIQTDIQSIKDAEQYLKIEPTSGEMNANKKEQIRNNMKLIAETLKNNREQLNALQEKQMIAGLQEELAKKDIRIKELDDIVANLNENVETLNATSAEQTKKINEQDKQLHRAYYCFGTKKELKDQNILTGGGLFSKSKMAKENFNEDYFISIDTREVTSIPLYARKATVRSSHPENSYRFVKDAEGNLTLEIVNAKSFWSMSKYLVVEVG